MKHVRSAQAGSTHPTRMLSCLQQFSVYCCALCEICEETTPDAMILQPVLQEIQASLHRCFFNETGDPHAALAETEEIQLFSMTLQSMTVVASDVYLNFEGKYFSAKFLREIVKDEFL